MEAAKGLCGDPTIDRISISWLLYGMEMRHRARWHGDIVQKALIYKKPVINV